MYILNLSVLLVYKLIKQRQIIKNINIDFTNIKTAVYLYQKEACL